MYYFIFPLEIKAVRGCCSHHGGVSGCSSSERQICNDGTLSPTCTCTLKITYIYGCTDKNARNYNSSANRDDGSCIYYVYGCTDSLADNYNSLAEKDDGSCIFSVDNNLNKNDDDSQESKDNGELLDTFIEIGTIFGGIYLCTKKH